MLPRGLFPTALPWITMNNLCDDLDRLNDGCPRAVEEFVAISKNDSSFSHSPQVKPAGQCLEDRRLADGPVEIITARRNDEVIRVRFPNTRPCSCARVLAFFA